MTPRIPRPFEYVAQRLPIALPNMGSLVAALTVLAYVAKLVNHTPLDRFIFDPDRIFAGEWWRLFAFPLSPSLDNPLWLLFYVLYVYYVLNGLEQVWGDKNTTLFVALAYLCTCLAACLVHRPIFVWFYILENAGLAFGTLFPRVEFLLFFILPVQARWLALAAGGVFFFHWIMGDVREKVFLSIVLLPYFLFFSPFLLSLAKGYLKRRR